MEPSRLISADSVSIRRSRVSVSLKETCVCCVNSRRAAAKRSSLFFVAFECVSTCPSLPPFGVCGCMYTSSCACVFLVRSSARGDYGGAGEKRRQHTGPHHLRRDRQGWQTSSVEPPAWRTGGQVGATVMEEGCSLDFTSADWIWGCSPCVQERPAKCRWLHQVCERHQSDQTAAWRDNKFTEERRREGSAGGGVWTATNRYVYQKSCLISMTKVSYREWRRWSLCWICWSQPQHCNSCDQSKHTDLLIHVASVR